MGQDQIDQNYLEELIESLPQTITQLDISINNIEDQIKSLEEDRAGIEAVMSMMTTAASAWIYDKAAALNPTYTVALSGAFGIKNLIQWAILNPALGNDNKVVYSDVDVVSGAPSLPETQQYNRQQDFPDAYDHLHHNLGLTGTYGILDKIDKLGTAKDLQITNRDAYQNFLKIYSRHSEI